MSLLGIISVIHDESGIMSYTKSPFHLERFASCLHKALLITPGGRLSSVELDGVFTAYETVYLQRRVNFLFGILRNKYIPQQDFSIQ